MTSGILACVTGCEINPFSEVRCKHLFSNCNSFGQGLPFWGEKQSHSPQGSKAIVQSHSQKLPWEEEAELWGLLD